MLNPKDIQDMAKAYSDIFKDVLKDSDSATDQFKKMADVLNQQLKLEKQINILRSQGDAEGVKALSREIAALKSTYDSSRMSEDVARNILETNVNIEKSLAEQTASLNKIRRMMGTNLFEKSQKGVADIDKMLKNIPVVGHDIADAFADMANRYSNVAAAIGITYNTFGKIYSLIFDNQRKLMDLTGLQIKDVRSLAESNTKMAFELAGMGITMEDVNNASAAIVDNFNNSTFATESMRKNISVISKSMGVSADDASKVMKNLMFAGNISENMANNLIASSKQLNKMSGAINRKVMKDIANNAGVMYNYFKGSATNMIATATYAAKLGTSLATMGNQADKLLEWDSSIEAELNSSVMLGKNVNLATARLYAFNGELSKMTDEVLRQVGSIDEFDKMNVIQKKAIAEAAGVTVEELGTQLNMQRRMNELNRKHITDEQFKAKTYGEQLDFISKIDDKKAKAAFMEDMSATAAERFRTSMDKIQLSLMAIGNKLLPAVEGILTGIASLVDGLTGGFGAIVTGVITILTVLGLALAKKGVVSLFSGMLGKLGVGAADATKGLGQVGTNISEFTSNLTEGISWQSILKITAIMAILVGGLIGLAYAGKQMQGVDWKGVAVGLGLMIGSLRLLVVLSKAMDPITMGTAIGSIIGLGAAMFLAGKGVQYFGEGVSSIIKSFGAFSDQLIKLAGADLVALSGGLVLLSGAIASFGVSGVMAGFGSLFTGGMIDDIYKLANIAPNLEVAAKAITSLKESFSNFAIPKVNSNDIENLKKLSEAKNTFTVKIDNNEQNTKIIDAINKLGDKLANMQLILDGRAIGEIQPIPPGR